MPSRATERQCTSNARLPPIQRTGEFSLRDIWEEPLHAIHRLADVNPPKIFQENASLWDAGNEFIIAAHDTINNYQT